MSVSLSPILYEDMYSEDTLKLKTRLERLFQIHNISSNLLPPKKSSAIRYMECIMNVQQRGAQFDCQDTFIWTESAGKRIVQILKDHPDLLSIEQSDKISFQRLFQAIALKMHVNGTKGCVEAIMKNCSSILLFPELFLLQLPDFLHKQISVNLTACANEKCGMKMSSHHFIWQGKSYCQSCYSQTFKRRRELWKLTEKLHKQRTQQDHLSCEICHHGMIGLRNADTNEELKNEDDDEEEDEFENDEDAEWMQPDYDVHGSVPLESDHLHLFGKCSDLFTLIRSGASEEEIEQEVNKCRLLCKTDHRFKTAVERKLNLIYIKRNVNYKFRAMLKQATGDETRCKEILDFMTHIYARANDYFRDIERIAFECVQYMYRQRVPSLAEKDPQKIIEWKNDMRNQISQFTQEREHKRREEERQGKENFWHELQVYYLRFFHQSQSQVADPEIEHEEKHNKEEASAMVETQC